MAHGIRRKKKSDSAAGFWRGIANVGLRAEFELRVILGHKENGSSGQSPDFSCSGFIER